jgi:hypothetical protein
MPKPTTNSIDERFLKAEVIGVALAAAGGDTASEWQWQREVAIAERQQHWQHK